MLAHALYLNTCFNIPTRDKKIEELVEYIQSSNLKFDSLVVTGISGLVIGSILSYKINKNLCVVRKSRKTHSLLKVESGKDTIDSYLIIDDIMDSGKTVRSIIKELRKAERISGFKRCIGGIFYDQEIELKALE